MEWEAYYRQAVLRRCGDGQLDIREQLRASLADRKVTLLLGAGVTAPLVGNWQELLNELAIMRCGSDELSRGEEIYGQPTLNQLRLYIEENVDRGMFLPGDTNVLEQGEYLMFDPRDPEAKTIVEGGNSSEAWRERFFAAQVKHIIHLLVQRHLKKSVGTNYEGLIRDFCKWLSNEEDKDLFSIGRKTLSDPVALKEILKKKPPKELLNKLNLCCHLHLDWGVLKNLLNDHSKGYEDKVKDLSCHFGMRQSEVRAVLEENIKREDLIAIISSGDTAEEKLKQITQHISVDSDVVMISLLVNKAVNEFSRPHYGTLAAVLKLCVTGGIRNVVTYNFDTVFDRLLSDETVQKLLGAPTPLGVRIYSFQNEETVALKEIAGNPNAVDTVCIYHVHGIVDDELDEVSPIIFSENSYQSYQSRIINWSNLRITDIMNTTNLLCVGFSGTDANFRQLVRLYKTLKDSPLFANGRGDYSIYLARSCHADVERYAPNAEGLNNVQRMCAYRCINTYFDLVQTYYEKQLGVHLLWTEDFGKMALDLEKFADSLST